MMNGTWVTEEKNLKKKNQTLKMWMKILSHGSAVLFSALNSCKSWSCWKVRGGPGLVGGRQVGTISVTKYCLHALPSHAESGNPQMFVPSARNSYMALATPNTNVKDTEFQHSVCSLHPRCTISSAIES